eukprot:877636-Prymnesium_polylepis.1
MPHPKRTLSYRAARGKRPSRHAPCDAPSHAHQQQTQTGRAIHSLPAQPQSMARRPGASAPASPAARRPSAPARHASRAGPATARRRRPRSRFRVLWACQWHHGLLRHSHPLRAMRAAPLPARVAPPLPARPGACCTAPPAPRPRPLAAHLPSRPPGR